MLATGEVKCIDEEIPFEIPTSWGWTRLGNLIDIKGGKRLPAGYKLTDKKLITFTSVFQICKMVQL